MVEVRPAVEKDLGEIGALAASNRRRLAAWEPSFWRASKQADILHSLWLQHLVKSDAVATRVATRAGKVVGFSASNPQPGQYFVDDVCVADRDDWPTAGVALFEAVTERPAFSAVPRKDVPQRRAADSAGLEAVSSFRALDLRNLRDVLERQTAVTITRPRVLAPAPPSTIVIADNTHVFVGNEQGGYAAGSSPVAAPPIYDVGGTACVVDRVIGEDRRTLLLQLLRLALDRGDVNAIVVVGRNDVELAAIADALGARHPVDIWRWPDRGR